ncbi:MAG: hypothetical protein AAB347_08095, partial [Bacteroidota bacterium]
MKLRVLIPILICVLSLIACETESDKKQKKQQAIIEQEKNIVEVHEWIYRKSAVLLSLKYEMQEKDVFSLLIEYDNDTMFGLEKIIKNQILEYAKRFNTSPKTIAAVIIDFESM